MLAHGTITHTPQRIASTTKVRDVKISPNGMQVLYQVQPFYKSGNRPLSELWIANTDVEYSARQLTNGEYNDRAGVWHPNGKEVYFLSDRLHPGGPGNIYVLQPGKGAGVEKEPDIISTDMSKMGIQGFEISPNGRYIAFTTIDEATEEEARKLQDRDDAKVMGEKIKLSRLKVFDLYTKQIIHLTGIRDDMHVEHATWSRDSKQLLYRLRENRGSEYSEMKVLMESIAVETPEQRAITMGYYPRSPSGQNIWLPSGRVATLQSYEPHNPLDARTLFIHSLSGCSANENMAEEDKLYGRDEDAVRIVDMKTSDKNLQNDGLIAVEVCNDVETHIDVISLSNDNPRSGQPAFTLYQTDGDAIWFGAWDAKKVTAEDGTVSFAFAAVLSSGPRHEPPNVWVGRTTEFGKIKKKVQLSSHLQWLADAVEIRTEVIRWVTNDGTPLSGLVRYPPGYRDGNRRLPTILFIHGGPYRRDIPDYMPYFCNWREFLASSGYLVISPNYRGSQGRGHDFAHSASTGIGSYDWPDCESMIDEVIRRGLADPERLGVAGWSHGGSLTAWGVTKTKTRFKAAIVGAGAVNWEGMVCESGSPELETEIGQMAPWNQGDPGNDQRKRSPIHAVSGVTTAVLILHGEKDERVPVGQAIGFYRGLKRKAGERGRESVQLVIYPREPHGFVERKHAEDVLQRVVDHFDTYV